MNLNSANLNSAELAKQAALFKRKFSERSPKFEKNFRFLEYNLLENMSQIKEKKAEQFATDSLN